MDSGNANIYEALRDFYLAHLESIMKVRVLTKSLVDRLVLVYRLYFENSGKINHVTGNVTVAFEIAKGPNGTTKIVGGIKRIMGMAHLVPETANRDIKRWYVNNKIDLEIYNRIY